MESVKFLPSKYYNKLREGEDSDSGDELPSSDIRLVRLSAQIKTLTRTCTLLVLLLGTAIVLLFVHLLGPAIPSGNLALPTQAPSPQAPPCPTGVSSVPDNIDPEVFRQQAPHCERPRQKQT